jgi:carboxymethylenebutenolidase
MKPEFDAIQAETVIIRGHNGDEIDAYLARPLQAGPLSSVIVLHHMPGYDPETKSIVRNFAEKGYLAICPNLHYRNAPGGTYLEKAAESRAEGGIANEQVIGDVAGAQHYLETLSSAGGRMGIIGFCSGGRHTLLSACALQFDAAVDCYGSFVLEEPDPAFGLSFGPIRDLLKDLSCPLLGIFGADDVHPGPQEMAELEKLLVNLSKEPEFHTLDGGGHAFMSFERPSYRVEPALKAWGIIWDFFDKKLAS